MKKIEATIERIKLREVKEALGNIGILGMTVCDIEGFGHMTVQTGIYRCRPYLVCALPGAKIELVVPDNRADEAVSAIVKAAQIIEIGDGKIYISAVEDAFRIRTEERGEKAL